MCRHSDAFVFLLSFSASSLPLLNVLNDKAGLQSDQLQQRDVVVRKRTELLKLKYDSPHQFPICIDGEGQLMQPAWLNLLRVRCRILEFGKRHKRPIGLEDFLGGIEHEAVDTLDTFCVPQFWNES